MPRSGLDVRTGRSPSLLMEDYPEHMRKGMHVLKMLGDILWEWRRGNIELYDAVHLTASHDHARSSQGTIQSAGARACAHGGESRMTKTWRRSKTTAIVK
jgi:hypothetical protein